MTLDDLKFNEIDVIAVNKRKDFSYILFNDLRLKVNTSTIEKFDIKANDHLDKAKLDAMRGYELEKDINKYMRVLIKKKPFTEYQLYIKGMEKFGNHVLVQKVLNEISEDIKGLDNDYLANYLDYFDYHNYGQYYIINYLKNAGITKEDIENIEFDDEREIEKAWSFFDSIKNKYLSQNFAKQKKQLFNLMLKRGFGVATIEEVLNRLEIDEASEEKKLKKDYIKAKEALSKKYKGRILLNKICTKLVTKGYRFEQVRELIDGDEYYED